MINAASFSLRVFDLHVLLTPELPVKIILFEKLWPFMTCFKQKRVNWELRCSADILKAPPEAPLISDFPVQVPGSTSSNSYNKQSAICLSGTGAETHQQLSLQSNHVLSDREQRSSKQSQLHSILTPLIWIQMQTEVNIHLGRDKFSLWVKYENRSLKVLFRKSSKSLQFKSTIYMWDVSHTQTSEERLTWQHTAMRDFTACFLCCVFL